MSEVAYLNALDEILEKGSERGDRTGTGTISLFAPTPITYNLRRYFPLFTSKKIYTKSVVAELLWFISGSTNVNDLDSGIWDEWANANGELGPIYGQSWRSLPKLQLEGRDGWEFAGGDVDQLLELQESLRTNPESRRHMLVNWNPCTVEQCELPPCHVLAQFYVGNGELSCQMYQRSADMFLGVPFNVASYSLLTCLLAKSVGLRPGSFTHVIGDAHIYLNHIPMVEEQLERGLKGPPKLELKDFDCITEVTADHINFTNYEPHPPIKAPIAV